MVREARWCGSKNGGDDAGSGPHSAAMDRADIDDLFAYTVWANALVLDAAAALSDAELRADRGISHHSILGTLAHMAAAEWIWLERWQGRSPTGPHVWEAWQQDRWRSLADLRDRWERIAEERRALVARLPESELQATRTFRRVDGTEDAQPVIAQMQHAVNHATLHRGQVVGMLRQLGRKPPATDLLLYYRVRQAR